ncbi:HalOD1 output domain-containing protein [Natrinema salsiterrestre]|uniref:Halobacterial output domain-containing protein n=1 Tax=Natrinema salsiterrestre TaxID=2950540 RepID=A0A9Q4L0L0_9EURY|nr:HalOD1 output domain-containing protein [Natrinema salsiterrestre]MDF9744267.1 hypothetical protein [Natrinema salsiterrestre]
MSDQSTETVTLNIVEQIATQKDVDPTELDRPLHSVIDTSALNRLFRSTKDGPRNGKVTFDYMGHTVHVFDTDAVVVEPRASAPNGNSG